MSKIIAIANQKGGVAKTTTAQILALGLKEKGAEVLVLDLDPQMNLTTLSGEEPDKKANIYKVFKEEILLQSAIVRTKFGYDMVKGSLELAAADMEFSMINREFILKDVLKKLENIYDYIIVDTPPALGILSVNALVAADNIIIPMTASRLSLEGLGQLYNTVKTISSFHNPNIEISGILISMYKHTNVQKKYLEAISEIADKLHIRLFDSKIRQATVVESCQDQAENVLLLKNQNVVDDYKHFVSEYLG